MILVGTDINVIALWACNFVEIARRVIGSNIAPGIDGRASSSQVKVLTCSISKLRIGKECMCIKRCVSLTA